MKKEYGVKVSVPANTQVRRKAHISQIKQSMQHLSLLRQNVTLAKNRLLQVNLDSIESLSCSSRGSSAKEERNSVEVVEPFDEKY